MYRTVNAIVWGGMVLLMFAATTWVALTGPGVEAPPTTAPLGPGGAPTGGSNNTTAATTATPSPTPTTAAAAR